MEDIVEKARETMKEQTEKNRSPAWILTELAVEKGRELAKKYNVDEKLVVVSLYLAHTVFNVKKNSEIMRNHTELSAGFAEKFLSECDLTATERYIILNSIRAHHGKVPTESLEAEVMKNAECYKFVTVKGCMIFLHELGIRETPFDEAVQYVLEKTEEKWKLLTMPECKKESEENVKKIREIFNFLNMDEGK
jgi:hypothetical protein